MTLPGRPPDPSGPSVLIQMCRFSTESRGHFGDFGDAPEGCTKNKCAGNSSVSEWCRVTPHKGYFFKKSPSQRFTRTFSENYISLVLWKYVLTGFGPCSASPSQFNLPPDPTNQVTNHNFVLRPSGTFFLYYIVCSFIVLSYLILSCLIFSYLLQSFRLSCYVILYYITVYYVTLHSGTLIQKQCGPRPLHVQQNHWSRLLDVIPLASRRDQTCFSKSVKGVGGRAQPILYFHQRQTHKRPTFIRKIRNFI